MLNESMRLLIPFTLPANTTACDATGEPCNWGVVFVEGAADCEPAECTFRSNETNDANKVNHR